MTNGPAEIHSLVSNRTKQILLGISAVGTLAFAYAAGTGESTRAWQALLVNFLFFSGLAYAGVVISAILQATGAHWGRSIKRLAEATTAFLPVAFVLLMVLLVGSEHWAPWVHHPVEAKQGWLNIPFFVTRQTVMFLLLSVISLR